MPSIWQISPRARRAADALKRNAERYYVWEAAFKVGAEYGYERHRSEWFGRVAPRRPNNPYPKPTDEGGSDDDDT